MRVIVTGDGSVLAGQRAEVVAVLCNLRGFTALSVRVQPEQVMQIPHDYYAALSLVVPRHEATLASFAGDGIKVLVNSQRLGRILAFVGL